MRFDARHDRQGCQPGCGPPVAWGGNPLPDASGQGGGHLVLDRAQVLAGGGMGGGRTPWRYQFFHGSHHTQTDGRARKRSEEHTSELQSLMRISYAVFCLKKKNNNNININNIYITSLNIY